MIYIVAGLVVMAVVAFVAGWWVRGAYWRIWLLRIVRRERARRMCREPFEIVTSVAHEIRPGAAVSVVGLKGGRCRS
jgi:hypothetical protein